MRQAKREITDKQELKEVLQRAQVCHLALMDGQFPYLVAMNYGYHYENKLILYFHCAKEGKKLDIIRQNGNAGFQMEGRLQLISGDQCCQYTMYYESIVGTGQLEIVNDPEERKMGLDLLMSHYGRNTELQYRPEILERTEVLKLTAHQFTGKRLWRP